MKLDAAVLVWRQTEAVVPAIPVEAGLAADGAIIANSVQAMRACVFDLVADTGLRVAGEASVGDMDISTSKRMRSA